MRTTPRFVLTLVCATVAAVAIAKAQSAPANSISAGSKVMFQIVSGYVTKTADKVPEDLYAFKPTPEVRSLGQIIAHVAD